jgi:Apea-like HEPN
MASEMPAAGMLLPSLRPHEHVHKILLSTTSRLTGEWQTEGVLMAQAFAGMRDRYAWIKMDEGPLSRSAYVLSFFARRPESLPEFIIPTYDHVGEQICSFLSVLFGKRFDDHGALEHAGFFSLPDVGLFSGMCLPSLPQNSHLPRADYPVALELSETYRLEPILFCKESKGRQANTFQGASKFYWRALQTAETDVEIAYLHLVTAGEILANGHDFEPASLMDSKVKEALRSVEVGMADGPRIVALLGSRMRQIKLRFVSAICDLIDDPFFERGEAKSALSRISKSSFKRRIGAAYDLRSKYLHTGMSFGTWVAPRGNGNEEVQGGKPVVCDKRFARALEMSPTYVGLERVLRYALLRYGERNGLLRGPSSR